VWDVAVAGAGPAGATTARLLAEAGLRTVLLEKGQIPRYKTCGGGLVGKTLQTLPDTALAAVERRCRTATLVLPGGLAFPTRREAPIICTVMRAAFDAGLTELAAQAGAEVRTRTPVTGLTRQDGHMALETPAETVRARLVVAADGASGPVARLAGWARPPRLIPAVESEIAVDGPTLARFADECRFDFGVVPSGYAWVFPKRDHLSVGVLTTHPGPVDLNGALARYLEGLDVRPLEAERHGHRIPFRPRPGPPASGRVLLVGDTAGLADPLTLEGISFALESAHVAARAVVDAGGDPHHGAPLYAKRLTEGVLAELAAASWFARLLYDHSRAARWGFQWLGREGCDRVAGVMAGEGTYRELLAEVPGLVLRKALWPFGGRKG
jgi:geranylgeranyl reductase family protein